MTSPARSLLRAAALEEEIDLPARMVGEGFQIAARSQKIYIATGAHVVFFEVFSDDGERIGIANAILEPRAEAVSGIGHVCVTLSEQRSNAELLAQIADVLVDYAVEAGLTEVMIVVPASHADSVEACCRLDPLSCAATRISQDVEGQAYVYRR
ncbi:MULTISPECIES: hypothetical protein [unclassified Variovorax]|uniref:hypothetical protein n=1 Tax=unclassified Variovorax TaxID=663243 RepID=UPI0008C11914|nr:MULTISPECIES: hypothetical protein [unclassified Variovorax]SEK10355.1 hypothetical protein SAMN05518853_109175 [Variovorax sp. OK202]SFD67584.1 hypothetical protein SAMN05444746_109175 [Variovorax sp. OK212]